MLEVLLFNEFVIIIVLSLLMLWVVLLDWIVVILMLDWYRFLFGLFLVKWLIFKCGYVFFKELIMMVYILMFVVKIVYFCLGM